MRKFLSVVLVVLIVISSSFAVEGKTNKSIKKEAHKKAASGKTNSKKQATRMTSGKTSISTSKGRINNGKASTKKISKKSIAPRINISKARNAVFTLSSVPKNMKKLKIDSKSAILIDMNTGKILYGKNIHERHYPASTTKILTTILALEKGSLSDTVKVGVDPTLVEPSKIYLKAGEKIKLKDLIYAALLPSANDAAVAIAEDIGGTVSGFANLMNKKAKAIGCVDSHFVTPNGLFNKNHYTSAYDMALIARYAMQNSIFRKIVSTKNYSISSTNKSKARNVINHNKMLYDKNYYYQGCIGIKTGYTSASNHTLVSAAKRGGRTLLAVILDDKSTPYSDVTTMLNYGFSLKK